MYYEREKQESLNERNIELEQVLENLGNKTNQEKTEEDFEQDVNYDYSDFLDNNVPVVSDDIYPEDGFYEEYDVEEEYKCNAELALEFIYGLRANPLHAISNEFLGYDLLKNTEKQADGSYNIKIKFEDLTEIIYYKSLHPSCLKTNEDLKNNINVLSEEQINVKDTNIEYDYFIMSLSFDKVEDNKYKGYFSIEEHDEEYNHDIFKYAEATVEFNQNGLINNIDFKEVPEENVPEELICDYVDNAYEDYSYSDYIQ